MNVKRWNQVVQDWGYVIADQPLLGQHQQSNKLFFPTQQPN